jgi:hypothetical protein
LRLVWQIAHETLSWKYPLQKMVGLSSKHEAMSSNSSTTKKKKNGMWMKKMLWFKAGKRVIVCMIWMKVHPPKFTLKFHLQWNIRDVAFGRWLSHEGCAFYPFLHVRTQCCSSPENAAKRGHLRSRHNPHHPHQCFDLRIPSLQND